MLNSLTTEDKRPSEQYVIYVEDHQCIIESELLYHALEDLKENQRNVLLMDYWLSMTDEEISKRLEVTRRTVYNLRNHRYKAIYGCFERNKKLDTTFKWYFQRFCDEVSPRLKYIEPLPECPSYPMIQNSINFNLEWSIRVNVEHILGDAENLEHISSKIRKAKNLPLLLETVVELARRKAVIELGLVVPQSYQNKLQHLISIYLTNMKKPDLAMTLSVMDGYYLGNTCLILEMAYLNRILARPTAK